MNMRQPQGFEKFSEGVIRGGTVTDADVNEWLTPLPWYARLFLWLWRLLRG